MCDILIIRNFAVRIYLLQRCRILAFPIVGCLHTTLRRIQTDDLLTIFFNFLIITRIPIGPSASPSRLQALRPDIALSSTFLLRRKSLQSLVSADWVLIIPWLFLRLGASLLRCCLLINWIRLIIQNMARSVLRRYRERNVLLLSMYLSPWLILWNFILIQNIYLVAISLPLSL